MSLRSRLSTLIAVRVVVGTLLLGSAILVQFNRPGSFPINPFFFLIGLTYALSVIYIGSLRFVERHPWIADAQLGADAILVSAFIHVTGGITSYFSSLYLLPIMAASTVRFRRGALQVATLSAVLYLALVVAQYVEPTAFFPESWQTLGRQELSFTQEEVKQLFDQNSRGQLAADLIDRFYQRTNGWATGLQLIVQAIEHLAENDHHLGESTFLEILKRSDEEVFDYFAEEVLQYETPETQDALLKLSLFNRIDHASASCVLPVERAYQLLASLQRSNLFISQVEGGDVDEYGLHPMFRRFLRRRLKAKIGEPGIRQLENQYADHLMKIGKWQKAGLMYAEARNTEAMAKILVERGRELLDAGLFEIVKRGYDAVTGSVSKLHPEIPRLRAHIARTEGDLDMADRLFKEAADEARSRGESRCEALSLHGLASVNIQRGEHARAFALASAALAKAPAEDFALRAR